MTTTTTRKDMPSRKWPLIWIATSGFFIVECFLDFTVDREEDAAAALMVFPFMVGLFIASLWFYQHRIEQRQQWREAREFEWVMSELELPVQTDWKSYENNVEWALINGLEYTVGGGWHSRSPEFAKGGRVFDSNDPRTVGWKR